MPGNKTALVLSFIADVRGQHRYDDTGEDTVDSDSNVWYLNEESETTSFEFYFLLDRSGSMDGDSIEIAIETLKLFIRSLDSNCTFNIYSFGSEFEALFEVPKDYKEGFE